MTWPRIFVSAVLLLVNLCLFPSFGEGQARRGNDPATMTDEELTREVELEKLRAINRALRKTEAAETRVIGSIQKIDCRNGIVFTVKTDNETFALASKNFDSLILNAFVPTTGTSLVGCEADVSSIRAVITYNERSVPNGTVRGDLISIEFVPPGFRILSKEEMTKSFAIDPSTQITDSKEQEAIIRSIRQALYQPKHGETRMLGYLDRIECSNSERYYVIRMVAKTYRLAGGAPETMPIRLFTRELEGMQFGCRMQPIDVPVVFIYRDTPDSKSGSDGEIISLEFVPRGFTLDEVVIKMRI